MQHKYGKLRSSRGCCARNSGDCATNILSCTLACTRNSIISGNWHGTTRPALNPGGKSRSRPGAPTIDSKAVYRFQLAPAVGLWSQLVIRLLTSKRRSMHIGAAHAAMIDEKSAYRELLVQGLFGSTSKECASVAPIFSARCVTGSRHTTSPALDRLSLVLPSASVLRMFAFENQ